MMGLHAANSDVFARPPCDIDAKCMKITRPLLHALGHRSFHLSAVFVTNRVVCDITSVARVLRVTIWKFETV